MPASTASGGCARDKTIQAPALIVRAMHSTYSVTEATTTSSSWSNGEEDVTRSSLKSDSPLTTSRSPPECGVTNHGPKRVGFTERDFRQDCRVEERHNQLCAIEFTLNRRLPVGPCCFPAIPPLRNPLGVFKRCDGPANVRRDDGHRYGFARRYPAQPRGQHALAKLADHRASLTRVRSQAAARSGK